MKPPPSSVVVARFEHVLVRRACNFSGLCSGARSMSDLPSPEPGPNPWPVKVRHFLMREWPYLAMLVLAMFGVAYTSVTRRPMTLYWLALAPFIGFVCVLTRWPAMK